MRYREGFLREILVVAFLLTFLFSNSAIAQTLNSVSHIHHVKVVGGKVLVLTHEGLFELIKKNNLKLIGEDKFDVMGFTTLGKSYFASGHPSQGSKMPNPIGLIRSNDGGISWKPISLTGKVDFHFLEGAGSDLYGVDSQSENLMYSADSGKKWQSIEKNGFIDIAVSPEISGTAIAIQNSELQFTENAFKSRTNIKNTFKIREIEWLKSGLYALGGSSLYKSTTTGKTWTKLFTFKGVPGNLSASNELILVTVGSEIYTSSNTGRKFKVFS